MLPVPVVGGPDELEFRDGDVVLLGVKSQDTFGAIEALAAHAPADLPVVSLQNGVANEPMLLRAFANVYGICVMAPTAHIEPGVVDAQSAPINGILDIGRYPSGIDETATDGRRRALGLRLRIGAAGRHHAVEVHEAADEPRQRGRRARAAPARTRASSCAGRAPKASPRSTRPASSTRPAEEDRARRADLLTVRPIDGCERGGGSSWQSLARGHRRDRGRLPQRRDRVAGPVSGTRHTRERGALRAREADGP